jgi:2-polyprenyl-3-methyl-5-hydroxy-6-metoxy-1,4-benzoquinol methylase
LRDLLVYLALRPRPAYDKIMKADVKFDQQSHFEFGKNWQNYLTTLTGEKIDFAQKSLAELLPAEKLKGATFFDIGCGSGLHSLCALQMQVGELLAMDFDPDSVRATTGLLQKFWQGTNYKVFEGNILKLNLDKKFDVVYSWGVLHHTGAMWDAIRAASQFVKPDGTFVIAIYQKTYFCGVWKILKRIYNGSGPASRKLMENIYEGLKKMKLRLQGHNPTEYIAAYNRQRGMNWSHDIVDWLGGHPYESATPEEIIQFVESLGFKFQFGRRMNKKMPIGFFGSGCGEFVFTLNSKVP